jgi:large subunit ribosomal protein L1
MPPETSEIKKAVEKALGDKKERKFTESFDLHIGLKGVDLKDPSKRFRVEVLLPHKLTKDVRLCVIADEATLTKAKTAGVKNTLNETELEDLVRNPSEAKTFIDGIDYFLAIPQMMATVGRLLGRFLGPAGKMPAVMPPQADVNDFVTRYGRTCRVRLRQNPVAMEDMSIDQIVDNVRTILSEVENRMEQGANNIRNMFVKTTMGPAIKIGV